MVGGGEGEVVSEDGVAAYGAVPRTMFPSPTAAKLPPRCSTMLGPSSWVRVVEDDAWKACSDSFVGLLGAKKAVLPLVAFTALRHIQRGEGNAR